MSTDNLRWFLMRLPSLFFGLFLFACGVVMNLYSGLGMSPWGVLSVGIVNVSSLSLGQASQLVGLAVLVIGWLLGFPPGFATLMNMYFIGYFIDVIMAWGLIPLPTGVVSQAALLVGSIVTIGVGSFFYLNPKLGAGPRDGLMMGFVQKTGRPVSHIRGAIEVTVLVIGYLMGGPVGVGTLVSALTVGYSVQLFFQLGHYDREAKHLNLFTLAQFLAGNPASD